MIENNPTMRVLGLLIAVIFAAKTATAGDAFKQNGAKIYQTHCTVCHQDDGGGVPMMQPELIGSPIVLGDKPALIDMVFFGSDSKSALGGFSNRMAGFDFLKDAELAALLTYIRSSFGNQAPAVSVQDVAAYRQKVQKK